MILIFTIAVIAAHLAATLIPPVFDIEVAPVGPIRQGDPIVINATLTYRGDHPIYINYWNYSRSCMYYLPAKWKKVLRQQPTMYLHVGWSEFWVRKGEKIQQTIDITKDFDITAEPGNYEIEVQGRLIDVSVTRDRSILLRSDRIKVPIKIVERGPGK